MTEFGYFLATEEQGPARLVDIAQQAEASGFGSVWISDHFHPWTDAQGQSPFVWTPIGGIAATTDLRITTAVTCPTIRSAHVEAPSLFSLLERSDAPTGSDTGRGAPTHRAIARRSAGGPSG